MFEVGFWELALLFALGLVVLGPEKLPKVTAQLGRYVGNARRLARTLTTQIRDEIEAEERRAAAAERQAAAQKPAPDHDPQPAHQPETFSRPGADSLIPRDAAEHAAPDESTDSVHRPQA